MNEWLYICFDYCSKKLINLKRLLIVIVIHQVVLYIARKFHSGNRAVIKEDFFFFQAPLLKVLKYK